MKEYKISINGNDYKVAIKDVTDTTASVSVNGIDYNAQIEGMRQRPKTMIRKVNVPAPAAAAPVAAAPRPAAAGSGSPINSPLPGTILDVNVKEGDSVTVGQKLMVLEAMKMENIIEADRAGVVNKIAVGKGDSVLEGDVLITIG